MRILAIILFSLSQLVMASCGDDSSSASSSDSASSGDADTGATQDSAGSTDAATTDSAGTSDAATTSDLTADSGISPDGATTSDGGSGADMAQDTGGPGPEGCRTNAECADSASEFGMVCASPHDPNACGIPPMDVCENNAQCVGMGPAGLDLICHAYEDSCSPDGIGSNCDESCVKYPTLCGDGGLLVCGPNGACEPRSCVDGFTCHAVQFCALGAPGADPHGCNFVTCQADADCDDGLFCVKGKCIETLGTCVEDMPVP